MQINRSAPVSGSAEILIAAPVETAWTVLSEIWNWPSWNPDIGKVSFYGDFRTGTEFHWRASGITIISRIEEIVPHERLVWTGRSPGIRAVHAWLFDEVDGTTRVRTEESFEGLLARLLSRPMTKMLQATLEKGLQSLKAESERRHAVGNSPHPRAGNAP